jgi:ABC-type nickel/cobalt efflux system permease component RcnA
MAIGSGSLAPPIFAAYAFAVGRTRPTLRDLFAMLCIAIALVFAGASAASIVDGVQHAAKAPHSHQVSLTTLADDHHHAPADHSHQQDADDETRDLQTGPGHHHSEPPAVALTDFDAPSHATMTSTEVVPALNASTVDGLSPGGLERPPRSASIDV